MILGLPGPAGVAAAVRVADLLAAAALARQPVPPTRSEHEPPGPGQPLHLTYILPRVELGGGAGVLLEQADQVARLGAKVTVLSHFPAPSWFPLELDYLQVPLGEPIGDALPPCDLIIAGHWEFVLPTRQLGLAPVAYLEQGEFHLYDPVPDQVQDVVAASVRAAEATFAIGRAATLALAERFGVQPVELRAAVDTSVFHPAPEPREGARGASRRTVLILGWDGPRTWAVEDARTVVEELAASHPDVRPVLVTSMDPKVDLPGEILLSPSQEELARRYREADVCVSCSRDASSPLVPWKAMASGAPVVATATDGVLACCQDGEQLLIAPIGDVDELVRRVRLLLDDRDLALKLADRARRTAEDHSWAAHGAEVLAAFRRVVVGAHERRPRLPRLGSFALDLDGLRFDQPGHEALLEARLEACLTRELAIPVAQPVLPGHQLFRWRTVAWRIDGEPGTTRVYTPARSATAVNDSPYQEGIDLLRARQGEEALDYFAVACERANRAEQAVIGRWVVLSLLAAERPDDASDIAVAFAHDFPSHPDYLYLGVVAALAARRPVDISAPLEAIRLLGRGARYEEWFDDPAALLAARLASP